MTEHRIVCGMHATVAHSDRGIGHLHAVTLHRNATWLVETSTAGTPMRPGCALHPGPASQRSFSRQKGSSQAPVPVTASLLAITFGMPPSSSNVNTVCGRHDPFGEHVVAPNVTLPK